MRYSGLTIVNSRGLRGVLGPPELISKALLEDLVDAVELSLPRTVKVLAARAVMADREGSWVPGAEVSRRIKARRKASR